MKYNKNQIYINYGTNVKNMTKEILENISLKNHIDKNMSIALKPNLVVSKTPETGATTHPEIAESVIEYLKNYDFHNITIMESSWAGGNTKNAYKTCGYNKLAEKYNIKLIDLNDDKTKRFTVNNLTLEIFNLPLNIDYMINLPVLKGHSQTKMTCALKNMKGCIPGREKRRYHNIGLHKPIAYLNKIIKQDLIIIDNICGDLSYELGGNPVKTNRIITGFDPVLLDTYCAELIGINPKNVEYINIAARMGLGNMNIKDADIYEYKKGNNINIKINENKLKHITDLIMQKNACSACYTALIGALLNLEKKGLLNKLKDKIYIGQGYKFKKIKGIGIGNCIGKCKYNIPGCPPDKESIEQLLEYYLYK